MRRIEPTRQVAERTTTPVNVNLWPSEDPQEPQHPQWHLWAAAQAVEVKQVGTQQAEQPP